MSARQFDYDNRPITMIAGIFGSLLVCFGFLFAYVANVDVAPTPPVLLLVMAAICAGSTIYFTIIAIRRRRNPHRITIDNNTIEVPDSRLSANHTRIPLAKVEQVIVKELAVGFLLIDIDYAGRSYRISENLFRDRSDFHIVRRFIAPGSGS